MSFDYDNYRRTKLISTLGPASNNDETMEKLINEGVNVFRLNFSHGTHEIHAETVERIRKVSGKLDVRVAILADLQGPKIRVGKIVKEGIMLKNHAEFIITTEKIIGEGNRVSTTYTPLPSEVKENDRLLLDDGLLELRVKEVKGTEVITEVVVGGVLTSNKGLNLPNVDIQAPALTEKDHKDLDFILTLDVDFLALSFVRNPEDLDLVNDIMVRAGRHINVISKIEKPEGVLNIDAIIAKSYGIMVARGDLGIEINQEQVPIVQKNIIDKCNLLGKPVIVATQMLDSMIRNPRPTRAEVSDVANAVLDGASAVMLSGETAAGDYPVDSVRTMVEIIMSAERNAIFNSNLRKKPVEHPIETDVQGICHSAVSLANSLSAKLIICITESGNTAREIARYRSDTPTIAILDENSPAVNSLCLTWGITVLTIKHMELTSQCFDLIEKRIENLNCLEDGDPIIISAGLPLLHETPTNMLKVHRVHQGVKNLFG